MSGATAQITLHATAIAVDGRGMLIMGAAGRGKSTLALGMIGLGAALVSDDQTMLRRAGDGITLTCPAPEMRGVIEVRGMGLLRTTVQMDASLALVVDLDQDETERLPPRRNVSLLGCVIDLVCACKSPNFPVALMLQLRHGRYA
jgi:HPr kinase/phosphorylase